MDRETKTERETEGRAEKGKRPTMPLTISGRCTMTTQLKLADLTDRHTYRLTYIHVHAYRQVDMHGPTLLSQTSQSTLSVGG